MKLSPTFKVIGIITLLLTISPAMVSAQEQNPETLLQAAINAEIVEGNLEKAIQLYEQILERFSSHRSVAARALLRLGQSHEKLGNQQAQEIYERLIRDYSDQGAIVIEARARLTALETRADQLISETREEKLLADADVFGGVFRDGKHFVYGNNDGDVEIRNLATGEIQTLTTEGNLQTEYTKNAGYCIPSPSGQLIAYSWSYWHGDAVWENSLRTVNLTDNEISVVYQCSEKEEIYPVCWTPDSRNVVAFRYSRNPAIHSEMISISVSDGSIRVVKTMSDRHIYGLASVSPDDRYIAYETRPESNYREIMVLPIDGSAEIQITNSRADDKLLGWSPDGSLIIFASNRQNANNVWGIRVEDGKPIGNPILLHSGVGDIRPLGISENGTLFYTVRMGVDRCFWGTLNEQRSGLVEEANVLGEASLAGGARFSPDGRKIAFMLRPSGAVRIINIYDTDTNKIRTIKPDLDSFGNLAWFADNRSLLASGTDAETGDGLYRINTVTGDAQLVLSQEEARPRASTRICMPNGQDIIYSVGDSENADRPLEDKIYRIVRRSLITGAERELYRGCLFRGIAISPDENWLAVALNDRSVPYENRANDIVIISLDNGDSRKLTTIKPQTILHDLVWSDDSKEIYTIIRRRERVTTPTDTTLVSYTDYYSIPIDGSEPEVTTLDLDKNLFMAYLAPGGEKVAWSSAVDMFRDELWALRGFIPDEFIKR